MVFKEMAGGQLFSILFFISLLFASITSLMNLLEVPIEALQNRMNLKRYTAVVVVCAVSFGIGLFLEDGNFLSAWMDFMSIYIIPLGALIAAVMFFWIIGSKIAKEQAEMGASKPLGAWFEPMAKYVFVILTVVVVIGGILYGGIG